MLYIGHGSGKEVDDSWAGPHGEIYRKRLTSVDLACEAQPSSTSNSGSGLETLGADGQMLAERCAALNCYELLDHHAGQIRTAPVQAIRIVAEQQKHLALGRSHNSLQLLILLDVSVCCKQHILPSSREMQHIGLRNLWLPVEAAPLAGQKLCWMPRRQEQIVTNLQLTWSVILWSGFPSPSIFHLPSCLSGWWFSPSESLVLHNHRTRSNKTNPSTQQLTF